MPNQNSQPTARRILLLTATITPPQGAPELVRTDPKIRLADYDAGLAFYLTLIGQHIDRIIFAENSNSDVTILKDRCARSGKPDAVEFISFYGLDYPPEYGRGYGEMRLIDYAIEHSQTIAHLGQSDVVWKMTGRYICRNLPALIRSAPPAFDLYCDLKDRPMPWMDLRLFAFTKPGYDRLLRGVYTKLSRAHLKAAPEKEMRNHIGNLLPTGHITPRFRKEPLIDGIRGNDGQNYSKGKNLAKYAIRAAARKLVPFLWI
ncbi:MAG TPA: hypothetical protein VH370_27855 [Humisphaera sp.]|nr:hypothetical protein [Humisphaera sp.]